MKFRLTSRSSQRRQLDPADFMSATQMSKDRRECKVVLEGKRVSVPREGLQNRHNRRKRSDSSEMQNAAAEMLQVVAPHQMDRRETVTAH